MKSTQILGVGRCLRPGEGKAPAITAEVVKAARELETSNSLAQILVEK
jgi:hypothetical protein